MKSNKEELFESLYLIESTYEKGSLFLQENDDVWETKPGEVNQAQKNLRLKQTSNKKPETKPKANRITKGSKLSQPETKESNSTQEKLQPSPESETNPSPQPKRKRKDVSSDEIKKKPFSPVVKLFMTVNEDTYEGSGVLVGPNHVLTAGHNVLQESGEFIKEIKVFANYSSQTDLNLEAEVLSLHVLKEFRTKYKNSPNTPDPAVDVALIVIDTPLGLMCGWHSMGLFSEKLIEIIKTGIASLGVYGYPDESPDQMQYDSDLWREVDRSDFADKWKYSLSTSRGQSGSGIILQEGRNHYLIGIHTRAMSDYNVGFRFNITVLKEIVNIIENNYKPLLNAAKGSTDEVIAVDVKDGPKIENSVDQNVMIAKFWKLKFLTTENELLELIFPTSYTFDDLISAYCISRNNIKPNEVLLYYRGQLLKGKSKIESKLNEESIINAVEIKSSQKDGTFTKKMKYPIEVFARRYHRVYVIHIDPKYTYLDLKERVELTDKEFIVYAGKLLTAQNFKSTTFFENSEIYIIPKY